MEVLAGRNLPDLPQLKPDSNTKVADLNEQRDISHERDEALC